MNNTLFEPEYNYKSGWIKIFRSIRNHWVWNDPVKLKWWIDILLEVNHSGKTIAIGYKIFECKRGECIISLQSWGNRWNVSKTVVNNFFRMLESDNMIKTVNETVTTRLIVCNYDIYQNDKNAIETQSKRNRNAMKTQQSTTKNEEELKNEKEEYTYSKFYDLEIEKSKNDSSYLKVVKTIFGENSFNRKLRGVLSLENQLSFNEFSKLIKLSASKNKSLIDMIENIENGKYYKNRVSLYKILSNWLNKD